jgi:hypothetical protein
VSAMTASRAGMTARGGLRHGRETSPSTN